MMSDEMLNVLYVGTLPPHPGGSAISGSGIIIGLAQHDHRVRALSPITAEAAREGDSFAVNHADINVTRFTMPYHETAPNISPSDDYRHQEAFQIESLLPDMIAQERPDLIFIGRETFAWTVPDIATAYGLPCIMRVAGGTTLGILQGTHSEASAQHLLQQFTKADAIVVPAKHLATRLRQAGFEQTKVIPNAIDLRQFKPGSKTEALLRELSIRPGSMIVMHISNIKHVKRPLDLVNTAQRALGQNPELVFVIVGDGLLRQEMEAACRRHGVSDSFRFAGWVDYERIPAYINLSDMVVMPGELDTQARVYLETQACGRTLIASDIPAAREVITDGETGLLFRMGDISDLTDKILLAASDATLRARIGHKARERVQAHALDHAVANYIQLMREVVRAHHAKAAG